MDGKLLIEAIKAGSEEVFQSLFRAEFNNVVFFVNKFINNQAQAEDIAQDSFIALWKARASLDTNYSIRTFLYTIARNRSLNYLRSISRRPTSTIEQREERINIRLLESEDLIQKIESMDLQKMIDRVYLSLPDRVREYFVMSRKDGLSYKEIALKKGVSTKVVEYNISIALKLFRKNLKGYMGFLCIIVLCM